MSKLALDPKPAPSVFPVRDTHPLASYLGGFGLHGERDVFLQSAEFLVCLSLERIGEHTAVRAGVQRRGGQFVRGGITLGRRRLDVLADWR